MLLELSAMAFAVQVLLAAKLLQAATQPARVHFACGMCVCVCVRAHARAYFGGSLRVRRVRARIHRALPILLYLVLSCSSSPRHQQAACRRQASSETNHTSCPWKMSDTGIAREAHLLSEPCISYVELISSSLVKNSTLPPPPPHKHCTRHHRHTRTYHICRISPSPSPSPRLHATESTGFRV
jgi:hypothetical protein